MSDRLTLANAIEDTGVDRPKAERLASVIVDLIHDSVATKGDVATSEAALRRDIASLRAELKADIAGLRAELKGDLTRLDIRIEHLAGIVGAQPNAIMLRLGALMVVLTGVVLAALRYLPPLHF